MTTRSPTPKIPEGRIAQVRKCGASGGQFHDRTSVSVRACRVIVSGVRAEQRARRTLALVCVQNSGCWSPVITGRVSLAPLKSVIPSPITLAKLVYTNEFVPDSIAICSKVPVPSTLTLYMISRGASNWGPAVWITTFGLIFVKKK